MGADGKGEMGERLKPFTRPERGGNPKGGVGKKPIPVVNGPRAPADARRFCGASQAWKSSSGSASPVNAGVGLRRPCGSTGSESSRCRRRNRTKNRGAGLGSKNIPKAGTIAAFVAITVEIRAPGLLADLVVLSRDPSDDIRALTAVQFTLRSGRIIYRKAE